MPPPSTTPAKDFLLNTQDFMRNNILLVNQTGHANGPVSRGTVSICVYPAFNNATGYIRKLGKPEIDVYYATISGAEPMQARPDPFTFQAYFCPYADDSCLGVVLGHAASIMLTTQMDGCSFGRGSVTENGEVLVFHANAKTGNNTRAAMTNAQDKMLRTAFRSQGVFMKGTLAPNDYLKSKNDTFYAATTFGEKDAKGRWNFYAQRFSVEYGGAGFRYGLKEVVRYGLKEVVEI